MNFNTSSTRTRIDNVLSEGMKRSLRSISLLSTTSAKQEPIPTKKSLDLDSMHKPINKRTPPTRSSTSSTQSVEEAKPSICLSPSKALTQFYDRLNEFEYKEITGYPEVFYIAKTKRKFTGKFCDDRLYYRSFVGDHIAYRYEIMKLLGDGSFGMVLQCFDHKTQSNVAIKILRKGKKFAKIGEMEARVLDVLRVENDDDGIVKKIDQFKFRGHFFIVYELLSIDLYQFLKKSEFRGANLNIIKRIAVQVIIALKHIHTSGFIHCDLKPENILFKVENKSGVKLIDFGSACEKNNKVYTYIQSRFYRAPEVILDAGYSEKIDMWSLGCILYELYKGVPIFQGSNELDQLCKIVEVLGEVPESLVQTSKRKSAFFDEDCKLRDKNGELVKPAIRTLAGLIKNAEKNFIDFLIDCLKLNPEDRIDPEAALSHPWIRSTRQVARYR